MPSTRAIGNPASDYHKRQATSSLWIATISSYPEIWIDDAAKHMVNWYLLAKKEGIKCA